MLTLAELLDAGLTPERAFDQEGLRRLAGPKAPDACAALRSGRPLSTALATLGFEPRVLARVEAAEASGRVASALRRLANEHGHRGEQARKTAASLLYPMFLIHFAAVARGIVVGVGAGMAAGIFATLQIAAPFDIVIYLIFLAFRSATRGGRAFAFFDKLPFANALLRDLSLAPFLWSLADLYESGMPLDRAVTSAARGANPAFANAMMDAAAGVRGGNALLPGLARSRLVDDTVLAVLQPAETTGTLGEALPRAAELVDARLRRSLQFTGNAPGKILYAGAILLVFWIVYQFYGNYFSYLDKYK
ncbi:MAG: type II secretion system F family protein [Planctomycetes bacterium]|nr:type II secretion system F family protein [Planctomycetota bacterium]